MMNYLFFINFILSFGMALFVLFSVSKRFKSISSERAKKYLVLLSLAYLVLSMVFFLWFVKVLEYSIGDLGIIFSFLLLAQNILLYSIIHLFVRNRNIFYFFIIYISLAFYFVYNFNFIIFFSIASFLVSLLLFVSFAFRFDEYKKVGYLGIIYSLEGIVFSVLFFFGLINLLIVTIFLVATLFLLFFFLLRDLEKFPLFVRSKSFKKRSPFLRVLGHFVFIIVFINFIFIGTLVVHEFGHFSVSKLYGCEYQKIVYENQFLHTDISCPTSQGSKASIFGGIFLPIFIALLLILLGGPFMKEIGLLLLGFNILSISKDLVDLNVTQSVIFFISAFGAIILGYGIYLLAKSRIEEDIYLFSEYSLRLKKRI